LLALLLLLLLEAVHCALHWLLSCCCLAAMGWVKAAVWFPGDCVTMNSPSMLQ
jgi:hypothetical protein